MIGRMKITAVPLQQSSKTPEALAAYKKRLAAALELTATAPEERTPKTEERQ